MDLLYFRPQRPGAGLEDASRWGRSGSGTADPRWNARSNRPTASSSTTTKAGPAITAFGEFRQAAAPKIKSLTRSILKVARSSWTRESISSRNLTKRVFLTSVQRPCDTGSSSDNCPDQRPGPLWLCGLSRPANFLVLPGRRFRQRPDAGGEFPLSFGVRELAARSATRQLTSPRRIVSWGTHHCFYDS